MSEFWLPLWEVPNQEYQTYLTERNVDEEAVRMSASMLVLCAFLTIAVLVWLAIFVRLLVWPAYEHERNQTMYNGVALILY